MLDLVSAFKKCRMYLHLNFYLDIYIFISSAQCYDLLSGRKVVDFKDTG